MIITAMAMYLKVVYESNLHLFDYNTWYIFTIIADMIIAGCFSVTIHGK